MRQWMVGAALLVSALIVTFATASILQGMAIAKRTMPAYVLLAVTFGQ